MADTKTPVEDDIETFGKAKLYELQKDFVHVKKGGMQVDIQFNPETLKLSYSNQSSSSNTDTVSNTKLKQFVGGGTTKLSLQLWFDVTVPLPKSKEGAKDVRQLTEDVIFFITVPEGQKPPVPPGVCFAWGSFLFKGVVESLEESLEFFSQDGIPLRASISLSLSGQKPLRKTPRTAGGSDAQAGPGSGTPGTVPLSSAPMGVTLQSLAASAGLDWRAIADANNIENPRLLPPGQSLNLNIDH